MGGKREIPKADAAASRHINQLAVLRKQVAALQKVAKRHVAALVENGSCYNERYRAYVSHSNGGWVSSKKSPADAVRLVPWPEPK